MLSRRVMNDRHPRSSSGHPPHNTTGVASNSCSQASRFTIEPPMVARNTNLAPDISLMACAMSGIVRIKLIQKRRLMSFNSGFSSATVAAETVSGSKAMPQMGHASGLSLRISGCMGQVYSVVRDEAGEVPGLVGGIRTGAPAGRFRYCSGSVWNFCAQDELQ